MDSQSEPDKSERTGKHLRNYVCSGGLYGRIFVNLSFKNQPYMVVGVYPGQAGYINMRYVGGEKITSHGGLIANRWDDPEYDYDSKERKNPEECINPYLVEKFLKKKLLRRVLSSHK